MKQDINLIPVDYVERRQRRRDLAAVAAITAGCLIALAALSYLLLHAVNRRLREARDLRTRAQALRSQQMELVALAAEKQKLMAEMTQLLEHFQTDRWIAPLSAVGSVPEGMLISGLEALEQAKPVLPITRPEVHAEATRRVQIRGWALSDEDLGRFVDALNRSAQFAKVEISLARREDFHGLEALCFEVDCEAGPPTRPEGGAP